MDTLKSLLELNQFANSKLHNYLIKLRKENTTKIFEIDAIEQKGSLCSNSHKEAKVFEIGIHLYQMFAEAKMDIGTIAETKRQVCVCEKCYVQLMK